MLALAPDKVRRDRIARAARRPEGGQALIFERGATWGWRSDDARLGRDGMIGDAQRRPPNLGRRCSIAWSWRPAASSRGFWKTRSSCRGGSSRRAARRSRSPRAAEARQHTPVAVAEIGGDPERKKQHVDDSRAGRAERDAPEGVARIGQATPGPR